MSAVLLILMHWYEQDVCSACLHTASAISDYKHRTGSRPLRTRTDHMHTVFVREVNWQVHEHVFLSNIKNFHLPQLVAKKEPYNSVGTATCCRLRDSGIEARWGTNISPFPTAFHTGSEVHPTPCILDTGAISLWQSGWGVASSKQTKLTPMLRKDGGSILQPICAYTVTYKEKSILFVT
jgi:hypothetical protein